MRPTLHEACPVGDDGPTPDASSCPLPAPPSTLTSATSARGTSRSGGGVGGGTEALQRGVGAMRPPSRTPVGRQTPRRLSTIQPATHGGVTGPPGGAGDAG